MPNWKKVILSGSNAELAGLTVTSDITASIISASSGFTGSLFGSSSYATTASYALNGGSGGGAYTSEYVTANTTAENNKLYVFATATAFTLTLPATPTNGDSLYVSNRSGISTNEIARNGESIMGSAENITLDVAPAAFKLTYAAGSQGWVITGAGGAGVDTNTSASLAILSGSFLNVSSSYLTLSSSITPLSASLTTTDQAISSSTATLSGSASTARDLLALQVTGSSLALSSSASTARDVIVTKISGSSVAPISALSSSASTARDLLALQVTGSSTALSSSASTARNLIVTKISGSSTSAISTLSASLTTTDQTISASVAALSSSASTARISSSYALTSSYAVTASYALNGGSGGGAYTSEYVTANTAAENNKLYVFTSATAFILTLPLNPTNGDSLYVSNRSGINTNTIARNGQLIMGLTQDLTLDVAPASFKLTYAAGSQGWVITGAGGAGVDTNTSASLAILSGSFLNVSSSYLTLSASITPLSASLTTTDQAISSSIATLSGSASAARQLIADSTDTTLSASASTARDVLVASITGSSHYSSSYMNKAISAVNQGLYVYDDTTNNRTQTLPTTPTIGDTIKISNRSGLITNVVARNGQLIMGSATDLTLNTATAAFEMIFSGGSQGWVIIGAGTGGGAVATGSIVTSLLADNAVTYDKLENRYTEVVTISTLTGAFSLDWSAGAVFVMSNSLTGNIEFDFTNFKVGQTIDIYNLTGVHTITFDSDAATSETFNKCGGVDYVGASTNLIQVQCVDDSATAVFNYSVSAYVSDTTPS